MLCDAGFNVNASDKFKDTPLHSAADQGHTDIVKLLVDAGAAVTVRNLAGKSPLDKAKEFNESWRVKKNDVVAVLEAAAETSGARAKRDDKDEDGKEDRAK